MKKTSCFLAAIAAALTVLMTVPAFAATFSDVWKQDGAGNWFVEENGQKLTNAWFCDDAVSGNGTNVWYLLGPDGNMISAGLVQDQTGNYYSLETNHNGYFGMLRYKSGSYDGVYLDLESSHNGAFAAIKNADGIDALEAKYGVTKITFGNETCKYSSQMNTHESTVTATVSESESVSETEPDPTPAQEGFSERDMNGFISWMEGNGWDYYPERLYVGTIHTFTRGGEQMNVFFPRSSREIYMEIFHPGSDIAETYTFSSISELKQAVSQYN